MFNNLSALHSCVSIARSKLHTTTSSGTRNDMRLCRWVLLKNSLTHALSRSTEIQPPLDLPDAISPHPVPQFQRPADEESDSFLFPDGDVFADSFVDDNDDSAPSFHDDQRHAEAQWLDSLLEALGETDAENDPLVTVVTVDQDDEEDQDSELTSLFDLPSFEDLSPPLSPELVHLPPSPPLVAYTPPLVYFPALSITYSQSGGIIDDADILALPDVIEDTSSDSDSESLNTPFTGSTSSLNEHPTQSPTATRPPMIHIVDRDHIESDLPYPYDFHQSLPSNPAEDFLQEC